MASSDSPTIVRVDTYTSKYSVPAPGLLHMERIIHRSDVDEQIDTFGKSWSLAWSEIPPNQVSVFHGGRFVPLVGKIILFIPPYSVVHWRVEPGIFTFECLLSKSTLPENLPRHPIAWQAELEQVPRSLPEMIAQIGKSRNVTFIGREEGPSAIPRKIKAAIDNTYMENDELNAIAKHLGIAPSVLSRRFKACYGLSPIQYRNNVRIMDSLESLVNGSQVTDAGLKVGFEDVSQYNEVFRRLTKAVPSQFNLSKLGRARDLLRRPQRN